MNFSLSVSPTKEMGRMTTKKKSPTSAGVEETISGFDHPLLFCDRATSQESTSWVIMVVMCGMHFFAKS